MESELLMHTGKLLFPHSQLGDTHQNQVYTADAPEQLGVQYLAQGHVSGRCWEMLELLCWLQTAPHLCCVQRSNVT